MTDIKKLKRLTELKSNPDLALYDEINERANEVKEVIEDYSNEIATAIEKALEQHAGVLENLTEYDKCNLDVSDKLDKLKDTLDNLEIEVEI